MGLLRDRSDELDFLLSQVAMALQFLAQVFKLFLGWEVTSQQEVNHAFSQWLMSSWSLDGLLLDFGNRVSSEGDTGLGIQLRSLIVEGRHLSHSSQDLIQLNFGDDLVAVFLLDCIQFLNK